MNTDQSLHYMSLALSLAEKGRLTVSPNPMVGCVIVKNNRIIGTGFHQRAGEAHAEIHALTMAGAEAEGATLYVSLEPCCHVGRTPPCVNALIQAKVHKVYVACLDPNPQVSGQGIALLRDANIEVEVGLGEQEALHLNEQFFHYIKTQRPFVMAKWGMSLDGETITAPHDHKQITNQESQVHTHQLRQQVDAILVGAQTVREDDPQLTVRWSEGDIHKQPLRVILAGQHPLSSSLKIFSETLAGHTLVFTTERHATQFLHLQKLPHIEVCLLPEDSFQQTSLPHVLDELGKRNILSLLVEGGKRIHESFFRENLVNKVHVYLSPKIIKGYSHKRTVKIKNSQRLGQDFYINAYVEE